MKESNNNSENIIEQAVQRFVDAQLQGQNPDIYEFAKQYPEFESQIRQRLRNLNKIDSLFNCLMQADDSDFAEAMNGNDLIGQKLGDFEILKMVGQGGMGAVFLAQQASLDREVALKVIISVGGPQAKNLDRFKRESKVLAKISHPNIVPIYEVGQHGPYSYFAMEYVKGVSLDKILSSIRNAPTNEKASKVICKCLEAQSSIYEDNDSSGAEVDTDYIIEMSRIIVSIASALDYAHEKGILHRDIKPSNILISIDGTAKLVDFGLAKGQTQENITITGEFFGTPSYVSPEQIRKPDTVDCRSDVFSLAATYYECLTLHVPFEGDTVNETLTQVISREPVPPKKYCPRLSMDFNTVLLHALEKSQDDRYQTAGDFVADINNILEFKPITAKRPSITRRAYKAVRRNPLKIVIVGVSILVIVLGFFLYSDYVQERNRAVAKELSQFGLRKFNTGEYAEALIYFQKAIEDNPQYVEAYTKVADCYCALGQDKKGIEVYRQAIRIDPEYDLSHYNLGIAFDRLDRHEEAIQAFKRVIIIDPNFALAHYNLGTSYSNLDRHEEAIQAFKLAITIKPTYAESHHNLGLAYKKLGRYAEAIEAYTQAVRINPDLVEAYCNLGSLYIRLGRHYEAIEACKKAVSIKPNFPEVYNNLGLAYMKLGAYNDAVEAYKQAIHIKPDLAEAHHNLGLAYGCLSRYREAIEAFKQAIHINPDLAKAHRGLKLLDDRLNDTIGAFREAISAAPESAEAHCNLGRAYNNLGYYKEAIEAYKKAIHLKPDDAEAHGALGRAYGNLGRYTEAVETYRRAINIDPNNAKAHVGLGIGYGILGRWSEAIEPFKQAIHIKPDYAEAYCALADTYNVLGRYTEAIETYKQAININPNNTKSHEGLGTAYFLLGEKDSALGQYEILKTLDKDKASQLFEFINKP